MGIDFHDYTISRLDKADIVLVFIVDKSLGEKADRTSRIDLEGDFVRIEVETALNKERVLPS